MTPQYIDLLSNNLKCYTNCNLKIVQYFLNFTIVNTDVTDT